MARRIESYLLPGPAGQLEALLEEPEEGAPREACLVCHPHPLFGGTMHNKVVYRLARGLRHAGSVILRFNFRGVGRSAGEHDNGIGEMEDAAAALAWLRRQYPELPYSLAGFSFGSRIALRLACGDRAADPSRVIAVGYPTRRGNHPELGACAVPKIFIQSANDEHGPRPELEEVYARAGEPKRLIWVEARDHFFAGALDDFERVVESL
ncbi:MAG: alpha/beta fold hydrolase [Bryobacteraceae bacterium]